MSLTLQQSRAVCARIKAQREDDGSRMLAFTLIELVISAALMSLILVSAYLCLEAAFAGQKLIEPRAEVLQMARVALGLVCADLRCACPLSRDDEFVGTHRMSGNMPADSLDFATHNYTPRHAREGDFCEVSVFLDKDPRSGEMSLWRRRNPFITPDPFSGGNREELAKGVLGLKFEYSDGFDWYDTWGDSDLKKKQPFSQRTRYNVSGLPEAVRVTLWLKAIGTKKPAAAEATSTNDPPLVFSTVARLVLADSGQTGPSIGNSSNTGTDGSQQQQNPAVQGAQ